MKATTTQRRTSSSKSQRMLASVLVGVCAAAVTVQAQPTGAPVVKKKAVRRSVLDLIAETRKPRQGEVVPEGPAAPKPVAETPPVEGATTPPAPTAEPVPAAPVKSEPGHAEPSRAPQAAPPEVKASPRETPAAKQTVPGPRETRPAESSGVFRPAPLPGTQPPSSSSGARFVAFDKAKLRVVGQRGNATLIQWRLGDAGSGKPGPWEAVPTDAEVTERREFRTGVGVSIEVRVDDQASITVEPLTRVLVERRLRSDGTSLPGVTISRGEITIAEGGTSEVFVKTGLDSTLVRSGRVSFDGADAPTR